MQHVSQSEFLKQLTENFPTSEDSCFDFPDIFTSFWDKFYKDLLKLIRQLPSILFRGVANQLDPAYKEMRQHYMNCDIKNLTFRGLKPFLTVDYKLTNGLYYSGRNKGPRTSTEGLEQQERGRYVPLTMGSISDTIQALFTIPNWDLAAERMGIMVAKLVTYIYSSNAPFLDPSMHFKVPCAGMNYGLWRDKGKFDAGAFGRYGHPLSPFTIMALMTPQLESDKTDKENNCIEVLSEYEECEEDAPGQDTIMEIYSPEPRPSTEDPSEQTNSDGNQQQNSSQDSQMSNTSNEDSNEDSSDY